MKKLGEYLLANNMRAAIVALLCALAPLIQLPGGFIAAVIVGLVTLRKGAKAGLFVVAFAILPAISLLVSQGFEYGVFYTLFMRSALIWMCVLVWVFALILRRWNSWILVLETMALIGVIAVLVIHASVPDLKQDWINFLMHFYKGFSISSSMQIPSGKTADSVYQVVPFATGSAAFLLFFGMFLLLLLARWWQSVIFLPGGFRQEFIQIRVHRIAAILLVIATIGMFGQPAWLMDVYPVLLLPFMVAGLSVVHHLANKRRQMIFLLIAVYIALVLLYFVAIAVLSLAVLSLVGFIDSWSNFRREKQLA